VISLRPAVSADAAAVAVLLRASIEQLCAEDHGGRPEILDPWIGNKTPDNVGRWIAANREGFIVALWGGRIAGAAAISPAGEILLNYVDPAARFNGVSSALLAGVEARARALDVASVYVVSTGTALIFYTSRGYVLEGPARQSASGKKSYPLVRDYKHPDRRAGARLTISIYRSLYVKFSTDIDINRAHQFERDSVHKKGIMMSAATASIGQSPLFAGLDIRPLQPTIGAEIHGIDISQPLTLGQRDAIKAAILEYKVVFFRDQTLDKQGHADFARQFGPLYDYPSATSDTNIVPIHKISAVEAKKRQRGTQPDFIRDGDYYHTDTSWRLVPAWGAVLRAVDLPPVGGDTIWVDANLAYEGLSDELKARLEGLYVVHDFQSSLNELGHHDYPVVAHPAVRTHRETGKKILWVNFSLKPQFLGVELEESHALAVDVLRQYKRPEFQARFSWAPGSVAFWDNRAAVHYAVRNYGDYPRLLERILIADERLYADL
jgi:alpha-ketoglutarate-dependent taurine dioxygenase/GNAT superfamily N-acetyltransferase